MTDPIERIEWRNAASLNANDYNPNVVMNQELRLLEFSILRQGWVQPVLVTEDGTIIDGFHRAMLARESAALRDRYAGRCPCVVLPLDRPQAMLLTIRINRAKGTHVAFRMSAIVRELIDQHGLDPTQVAQEIGAPRRSIYYIRPVCLRRATSKIIGILRPGILLNANLRPVPFAVIAPYAKRAARDRVSVSDTSETDWVVAEVNGRIVGFAGLLHLRTIDRFKAYWVEPTERGHGYGRQLLEYCLAQSDARCRDMETFTYHPAIFRPRGFVSTGTLPNGAVKMRRRA